MRVVKLTDLDLADKRVLIRADLNVPLKDDGAIANDTRVRESIPTFDYCIEQGAAVLVMSHWGRPDEGEFDPDASLAPVADYLRRHYGKPVRLVRDWIDGVTAEPGELVLLENVRFLKGEKKNSDDLGKKMAALCDVFVNDAFGTAHRAQASTHAVAKFAPVACAGLLLTRELEALAKALESPARPVVAIVGGAKVSTKLTILKALTQKVDQLIVGGGIANTFLMAEGYNIGKSLYEPDLVQEAHDMIVAARHHGGEIPVPVDVITTKASNITSKGVDHEAMPELKDVHQVGDDDVILDIGPRSAARLAEIIAKAGTLVWNGPVGVFEIDQFGAGTQTLSVAIASSKAFSIAGGGDTLTAVDKYKIGQRISYISTGGGAFLEFLEGKKLPAVDILEQRAALG